MKTKDEIREAEMYSILRKHKLPLKKREDLMVDLTNFTHSQLKEQQEEIDNKAKAIDWLMELQKTQDTKLKSKQKEVDELREGIKIANQRVQSGAWDLDNLNDYIEELLNK
jgi:hypothetical protein